MAEVPVAMFVCMYVCNRTFTRYIFHEPASYNFVRMQWCAYYFVAMVCACHFNNVSGRAVLAVWYTVSHQG